LKEQLLVSACDLVYVAFMIIQYRMLTASVGEVEIVLPEQLLPMTDTELTRI